MQQWESLMRATNDAFEKRCYYTALELCQRALRLAIKGFEQGSSRDDDTLLAAIMVSHFNLADTYVALDQLQHAVEVYEDASTYLKHTFNNVEGGDLQKAAVLRAGSSLHFEWLRFFKKHKTELPEDIEVFSATAGLQLH